MRREIPLNDNVTTVITKSAVALGKENIENKLVNALRKRRNLL